jgi:hypothetical protein
MKKITLLLLMFLGWHTSQAQGTCATAVPVTVGMTTVSAVDGTNITTACSTNAFAKWYTYTPSQNYSVTVTSDLAINICKDTFVLVYTGTCGNLACYASDDDAGNIACNNGVDTNSYLSTVTFNAFAGTTYYIAWDGRWSTAGFDFQLSEAPYIAPVPSPVTFTAQAFGGNSSICCVADMNGDYLDDIVTVASNQVVVYSQKSTGGFNTNTYPATVNYTPGWSIAAGDYDRNGFNDLALGNSSRLSLATANSTGTGYTILEYPQSIFSQRTNFVDINNDGNLDLWTCHDTAQSHAYRNDGSGHLNFDISLMPTLAVGGNYQSQWSDLDSDGDIDMYLAKCRGGAPVGDPMRINLFYKNNGNGTFTESGAAAGINDGAQSWSDAIEDYDNDGDMDILLSNISDTNKLYRNNGNGTFTDVFAASGIEATVGSWELQAADFNNDGWIDFLWQNNRELYINNGNLTFTGYDLPFSEGAIGDLNNDGFLDVQMGTNVYINTPNQNNWLKVTLQGIQSNRNGIGAKVEIYGPWGKQTREIKSGNGFSHQSTLNAHFGLGTTTTIETVVIKWPSGLVDTYTNVNPNQTLSVVEGATLGVQEFQNNAFVVYPNPVKNTLNFKGTQTSVDIKEAQVFDLTGKSILKGTVKNNSMSVDQLTAGTYILLLTSQDGAEHVQKFIKE